LMDLDEVDQALAKLNDSSSDSPSYQKALTVAYLKQQVMELKRDKLSFDPSRLFNEMRSESNGDVSKLGLWFDLLAGMPRNQVSLDEMLDPLVVERNQVADEVDVARSVAIAEAFKAVKAIDTQKGGFKAIKQLIQWGQLSQVNRPWSGTASRSRRMTGAYIDAQQGGETSVLEWSTGNEEVQDDPTRRTNDDPTSRVIVPWTNLKRKSPQEQMMNAKPEELAKMLSDYKQAILQSLKLSMPLLSGADYAGFSKTLGNSSVVDSLARLNELENDLSNLSLNIQALRSDGQRLVDNADLEAELAKKVKSKKQAVAIAQKKRSLQILRCHCFCSRCSQPLQLLLHCLHLLVGMY